MADNNHLLTDPIPRLLRRLAVPAGLGFFFNTMFNVVDTFYAGFVSTDALAAFSLSFPVFFLIIAAGAGLSTGATALIGHELGAGARDKAERYAVQTLSFAMLHGFILTVGGIIVSPLLFKILGAEGTYLQLALSYMNAIFAGSLFFLINYACNASLNASGDTSSFRNFLIVGFFLNLLLDPWFLLGGFGLPPMGLAGIAWATVVVQLSGNLYLYHKVKKTGLLTGARWSHLLPQRRCYVDLARQGFPASLNMLTVALGIFVITWFLGKFGKAAVAGYGIGARLEQMALLPIMGLNVATLALVAQNNGAHQIRRVLYTVKLALGVGVSITAFVATFFFIMAETLPKLFTEDSEVIAVAASYLHVAAFVFCAYMILYICVFTLQGLKRPLFAIVIGLYRQMAGPVPIFFLFAFSFGWGIKGIWWGIFLITWSAALIALWYVRIILKKVSQE